MEMEIDETVYVLQQLEEIGSIPFPQPQFLDISTEIELLVRKLKEIYDQQLNCSPSRFNLSQSTSEQPAATDFEILEEFHQVGTQIDFSRKSSATEINERVEECLSYLCRIQSRIISEELEVWKRERQLAQNGSKEFTKNLEQIQKLCEKIIEAHWMMKSCIQQTSNDPVESCSNNSQQEMGSFTSQSRINMNQISYDLLRDLLNATLIVEKQPPQVMKIKTKFPQPVSLRFLLGFKLQPVAVVPIRASIISEVQAKELHSNNSHFILDQSKSAGILTNAIAKGDFGEETDANKWVAIFENLQLKRIDRKIKKVKGRHPVAVVNEQVDILSGHSSTSTVTDEKFCIHFQMEFKVGSINYNIWTLSLPVVVVTHGIQESQGSATIIWDNGFSSQGRPPFEVPEQVAWNNLAVFLNMKFESATTRGLDLRQLNVLKLKLLSYSQLQDESAMIRFSAFCKNPMADSPLAFWDWYYHSLKLVEKCTLGSWKNGAIYGFVGRTEAEALLKGYPKGTFLLRFSETLLGGISICFVAKNGETYSIAPFTSKNFGFRSLIDTIWDLENLSVLYPNIPKAEAFPRPTKQLSKGLAKNEEVGSHYVTSFPKISLPYQFF